MYCSSWVENNSILLRVKWGNFIRFRVNIIFWTLSFLGFINEVKKEVEIKQSVNPEEDYVDLDEKEI